MPNEASEVLVVTATYRWTFTDDGGREGSDGVAGFMAEQRLTGGSGVGLVHPTTWASSEMDGG